MLDYINMINVWRLFRALRLSKIRRKVKQGNVQRTIICNNCLGGLLYNDFGMMFNSPFINLYIPANHYVEMLHYIKDIKEWSLRDITPLYNSYPVGLLNNAWEIHFLHYKSFAEAESKWMYRTARMNLNAIYVILVETASCSYGLLQNFDRLDDMKKVAVTSQKYDDISCSYMLRDYDGKNLNGELFYKLSFGRYPYDYYNWSSFLDL